MFCVEYVLEIIDCFESLQFVRGNLARHDRLLIWVKIEV